MWVSASRSDQEGRVFHYQMPTAEQGFVLGVSSPHMLQQAARLAHGKPLFMDATFGMNDHKVLSSAPCSYATTGCNVCRPACICHQALPHICPTDAVLDTQYSLFIVLAMDDFGNGHPVAFCLTEKDDADTLAGMLRDFLAAVRVIRSDWWPSAFLVDDDAAEHNAVRCASWLQQHARKALSFAAGRCHHNALRASAQGVKCLSTLLPAAGWPFPMCPCYCATST